MADAALGRCVPYAHRLGQVPDYPLGQLRASSHVTNLGRTRQRRRKDNTMADEQHDGLEQDAQVDAVADDLVEEVSIDGMCGVY